MTEGDPQTPVWGDINDLSALLDVQPTGARVYRCAAHPGHGRPVIEGSQLLAQALVAAMRHAPGRRPISASMFFARVASTEADLGIELDEVANGRTFTALAPRVVQGGRVCAAGTVLLDVTAPDVIRHAAPAPAVAGPDAATPTDRSVVGREVRIVDGVDTVDSQAPVGPPQLDVWVRCREAPPDPAIHLALMTQLTGLFSLGAAVRPHAGLGLDQAHQTISTAVNAISLSIHAEIDATGWLLYHHRSTFAGDGMTHSECRVYDEPGRLLASFSVDSMLRPLGESAAAHGRAAL